MLYHKLQSKPLISDLVFVLSCQLRASIHFSYFRFISFTNLWTVMYVTHTYYFKYISIYKYISTHTHIFSNHFCFKLYIIICACEFYLMRYLNVFPRVFRSCSVLKIFLHIFLLLLSIFLLCFHGISPQKTSKHLHIHVTDVYCQTMLSLNITRVSLELSGVVLAVLLA